MAQFPVIDTDGHVLERQSDIRKYLEAPWNKRLTPLWPGDQPWDNDMMESFEMARQWRGLSAAEQVDRWHKIMDEHDIEKAICFPTGSGNIAKNLERRTLVNDDDPIASLDLSTVASLSRHWC